MRRFERSVAIGDSTTEGVADHDGQGGYRGWANRLAEHLAARYGSIEYANLAVRGLKAAEIRATQLQPALALKPDVATVVAGVNDFIRPRFSLEGVTSELDEMIGALRATGATVLSFTMPNMERVMPAARLLRGRVQALNGQLREVCARHGALLVDLEPMAVAGDPRLWDEDRLHANSLGHERIGRALAHRLGLDGHDASWADALPSSPESLVARFSSEAAWVRGYLAPWVVRHARGISSGDGRAPKQPSLVTVRAPR